MSEPLPDFLTCLGIVSVSDNVAEGQQVRAPARVLMALFGEEILPSTTQLSLSEPSVSDPKAKRTAKHNEAVEAALVTLERLLHREEGAPCDR